MLNVLTWGIGLMQSSHIAGAWLLCIFTFGVLTTDPLAAQQPDATRERNRRVVTPTVPLSNFPTLPGRAPMFVVPSTPEGPNPMQAPMPGAIGGGASGGAPTGMSKGRFETEPAPGVNR